MLCAGALVLQRSMTVLWLVAKVECINQQHSVLLLLEGMLFKTVHALKQGISKSEYTQRYMAVQQAKLYTELFAHCALRCAA